MRRLKTAISITGILLLILSAASIYVSLVDEEYPAALKELEEIIGLTVPALERLGE